MEILYLKLLSLRNEEHYQFHTDLNDLVNRYTPSALNIAEDYALYLPKYNNEFTALDVIRANPLTQSVKNADHKRDNTLTGLENIVNGLTKHFDEEKRQAAVRIKSVFNHFGNISRKPRDQQTASVNALINDLQNGYAGDIEITELSGWVTELKKNNDSYANLANERNKEEAEKTKLKMKEIRQEVDEAYHTLARRINALVIVNGPDAFAAFINELNQRIEHYNNIINQRKGRNSKKDNDE